MDETLNDGNSSNDFDPEVAKIIYEESGDLWYTEYEMPDGSRWTRDDEGLRCTRKASAEPVVGETVEVTPVSTSEKISAINEEEVVIDDEPEPETMYSLEEEAKVLNELSEDKKKLIEDAKAALAEKFKLKPEDFRTLVVENEDGQKRAVVVQATHKGLESENIEKYNDMLDGSIRIDTTKINALGHMTKELHRVLVAAERARGVELFPDLYDPENSVYSQGSYLDGEGEVERNKFSTVEVDKNGKPNYGSQYKNVKWGPTYRAVIDIENLARLIELSKKDIEKMPGGSPATAILLTEQDLKDLERVSKIVDSRRFTAWYPDNDEMRRMARQELPINPNLVNAAEEIAEIEKAKGDQWGDASAGVWVRSEEERDSWGKIWNTWRMRIQEESGADAHYGDAASPDHYLTHPDGTVELTYTWQPIR
jgi:hypothetical protein